MTVVYEKIQKQVIEDGISAKIHIRVLLSHPRVNPLNENILNLTSTVMDRWTEIAIGSDI